MAGLVIVLGTAYFSIMAQVLSPIMNNALVVFGAISIFLFIRMVISRPQTLLASGTTVGSADKLLEYFLAIESQGLGRDPANKTELGMCPICVVIREPNSRHCSRCNKCVVDIDNHCASLMVSSST
jgi:hypothetical protein